MYLRPPFKTKTKNLTTKTPIQATRVHPRKLTRPKVIEVPKPLVVKPEFGCTICLTVKHVAQYVGRVTNNIIKIASHFKNVAVLFFYDQSGDNTLMLLKHFQTTHPTLNVEIIINTKPLLPTRTQRIAYGRNILMDMIESKFRDKQYFIMMDGDDVCSQPMDLSVLTSTLQQSGWDGISFNRLGYYDSWALCFEPFIHHWGGYTDRTVVRRGMIREVLRRLTFTLPGGMVECYSAFNGLAIYRTEKFIGCRYNGIKQKHFDDTTLDESLVKLRLLLKKPLLNYRYHNENCEHIAFHLDAIRKHKARIRISKKILFGNHKSKQMLIL